MMRDYEPHVRRAIRIRMRNPALRKFLDSIDISQSVMSKFFGKLRAGEFQIDSPNELIGLLVRMAQNRVCDWVRHGQSAKMDYRREVSLSEATLVEVSQKRAGKHDASRVETEELMREVRTRLTPLERRLLDQRADDLCWKSIAEMEGRSAEAMRTQLRRSLRRVATELGILEETS